MSFETKISIQGFTVSSYMNVEAETPTVERRCTSQHLVAILTWSQPQLYIALGSKVDTGVRTDIYKDCTNRQMAASGCTIKRRAELVRGLSPEELAACGRSDWPADSARW